jgi:hypothetical protein
MSLAPAVEATRTPLDMSDFRGWLEVAGTPQAAMPALLALLALEHGRGKSVWGHNWGNIVATGSQSFQVLPNNPLRFRVFASHEEGAREFLALMNRKPELWAAAQSGDPERFIRAYEKSWLAGELAPEGRKGLASLLREFAESGWGPLLSPGDVAKASSPFSGAGALLIPVALWFMFGAVV